MRKFNLPQSAPTIETPRLTMRQIVSTDVESYFAFYSDSDVMRTWGTKPHTTIEETRALIDFHQKSLTNGVSIRWGISKRGRSEIIGDIGFWRFVKERHRGEIGAKLSKELWSSGYMYEAGAAIIDFGFRNIGLHSVEASVDPRNIGAMKLVDKLNFQKEGVNREHSFCDWEERYIDTHHFSLLEKEWICEQDYQLLGVL